MKKFLHWLVRPWLAEKPVPWPEPQPMPGTAVESMRYGGTELCTCDHQLGQHGINGCHAHVSMDVMTSDSLVHYTVCPCMKFKLKV